MSDNKKTKQPDYLYFKLGRNATVFSDETGGISVRNKIPLRLETFNISSFPDTAEALKGGHIIEIKKREYEALIEELGLSEEETTKLKTLVDDIKEEELDLEEEDLTPDDLDEDVDLTKLTKEGLITWIEDHSFSTEEDVVNASKARTKEEVFNIANKILKDYKNQ